MKSPVEFHVSWQSSGGAEMRVLPVALGVAVAIVVCWLLLRATSWYLGWPFRGKQHGPVSADNDHDETPSKRQLQAPTAELADGGGGPVLQPGDRDGADYAVTCGEQPSQEAAVGPVAEPTTGPQPSELPAPLDTGTESEPIVHDEAPAPVSNSQETMVEKDSQPEGADGSVGQPPVDPNGEAVKLPEGLGDAQRLGQEDCMPPAPRLAVGSQPPEPPMHPEAPPAVECPDPGVMPETEQPSIDTSQDGGSQAALESRHGSALDEQTADGVPELAEETATLAQGFPNSVERRTARRTIAPVSRGGAPRGKRSEWSDPRARTDRVSAVATPEVVCWQKPGSWNWSIGIRLDEELVDLCGVMAGDNVLLPDGEGRFEVRSLRQEVMVEDEGGRRVPVPIDSRNRPLLFRLAGGIGGKTGHRVDHCTSGAYLAVVPEEWKREADDAPVAPRPVLVEEKLRAHYFSVDSADDVGIEFAVPGGRHRAIRPKGAPCSLIGVKIHDASDECGPLFAGGPPRLVLATAAPSGGPFTVVVGLEGPGRGRWRTSFRFTGVGDPLNLDEVLRPHGGGWFFARLYDSEGNLLESLDFRYMRDLMGVEIKASRIPEESGHQPAQIEFSHGPEVSVRPAQPATSPEPPMEVTAKGRGTAFRLPATREYDDTRWVVQHADGSAVTLRFALGRVWWALTETRAEPSAWTDKPMRIPAKSATDSGRKRPRVPLQIVHRFRVNSSGGRSEATLVFGSGRFALGCS